MSNVLFVRIALFIMLLQTDVFPLYSGYKLFKEGNGTYVPVLCQTKEA